MANVVFPRAHDYFARNGSLQVVDLRMLLGMTNATIKDEPDTEFLDEFTDLDECDASGYARQDLASVALTYQSASLRSELSSASAAFGTLDAGVSGRKLSGHLLYARLGGGGDDEARPLFWCDQVATGIVYPYEMIGADVTIVVPGSGWLHLVSGL